jgi:putative ubiquitin-RnfH superfamily antitoxin RatB of RatAB toxin-antitoxin module
VTLISVTVIYALPAGATEIEVKVPIGATIADAVERSGIASRHPEVDVLHSAMGVFGKRADRHFVLADGDRVEIYRPLIAEPKESRRKRAKHALRG